MAAPIRSSLISASESMGNTEVREDFTCLYPRLSVGSRVWEKETKPYTSVRELNWDEEAWDMGVRDDMRVRKENDIDRVPAVVESGKEEKALVNGVKDISKNVE